MPPYVARLEFGFRERRYIPRMNTPATTLEHLSVLLISGPDARNFLQGQLSADMEALTPDHLMLACCNSPQGRAQAIAWVVARAEGIALLVSRAVVERIELRLRRYVLRAKVAIERDRLAVGMLDPSIDASETAKRSHALVGDLSELRWPGHRYPLVIAPGLDAAPDAQRESLWKADYLRAGLPQIYEETYERFVAQMLNLDLLDGISFAKGCYTGQEIIARTHYRGAVKRRMFRFRAACGAPTPGTRVLAADQHAGEVVDSIPTESGCELLAVVSLPQLQQPLALESSADVPLEQLALPYDVL